MEFRVLPAPLRYKLLAYPAFRYHILKKLKGQETTQNLGQAIISRSTQDLEPFIYTYRTT